jgi:hypothetical protein
MIEFSFKTGRCRLIVNIFKGGDMLLEKMKKIALFKVSRDIYEERMDYYRKQFSFYSKLKHFELMEAYREKFLACAKSYEYSKKQVESIIHEIQTAKGLKNV